MSLQYGFLVALGGAIGSLLRYAVGLVALASFGPAFPWGTLIVNVVGCFVIGLVTQLAVAGAPGVSPTVRLFLATGVCGGFTTFSAFSLEAIQLGRIGHQAAAFAYVAASVLIGLVAVWVGLLAGRLVTPGS
jgi:CrcB protein